MDMSESESELDCLSPLDALLLFLAYVIHSGVGCKRSYCRRNLLMYSLPVTTSSSSVSRSLRRRVLEARETTSLSSSLSCQTGLRGSLSEPSRSLAIAGGSSPVPASRKKRSSSGTFSSSSWSSASSADWSESESLLNRCRALSVPRAALSDFRKPASSPKRTFSKRSSVSSFSRFCASPATSGLLSRLVGAFDIVIIALAARVDYQSSLAADDSSAAPTVKSRNFFLRIGYRRT